MKRINSLVLVLAGLLLFAGAKQVTAAEPKESRSIFASSLADGGRIRMKHSPALGVNISIAVRIDGMNAGAFTKGHVYEKYLTPGRHELYVSRPGQWTGSWRGTLEVQRGETKSFVVKVTSREVILLPVSRVD